MELISRHKKQYRANLHCHSTVSDGRKTPQQLKELYKSKGYSILAITDHEVPYDHTHLSEEDFLLLTGYECYIRADKKARYDVYAQEIHLNLFARDPHNCSFVCYDPPYGEYLARNHLEDIPRVGSEESRRYDHEYIQNYINTAKENGYLVSYNHPYWSFEDESRIYAYDGCFSMELRNGSSWVTNRLEYNAGLYDRLLRHGKRIFCHGADDNHNVHPVESPMNDSFIAWTQIMADELSYPAVIEAMEKGEMYCSSGPQIDVLRYEDGHVHVECSEADGILLFTGSKAPQGRFAEAGECLREADFELDERALYLRVTVIDKQRNTADTRAYFPDELGR